MSKTTISKHKHYLTADHSKYDNAMSKSANKTSELSKEGRSLSASIALIDGPLGGIASRAANLNTLLTKGNILFGGAALATSAYTFTMFKAVKAAADFEVQQGRMNAMLKATGFASGQTGDDLEAMAQSVASGTLASTQGVRDAQAALLSFRSVHGETFGRTIGLAQDLSAVFGGDLASNARKLGKALEDPERQLSRLETTVGTFSSEARESIIQMQKMGDLEGAQTRLLDEMTKKIGGAAAGQNTGLVGALDSLSQSWDNLLVSLGKGKLGQYVQGTITWIDAGLSAINRAITETDAEKLLKLQAQLKKLQNNGEVIRGVGPIEAKRREQDRLIAAKQKEIAAFKESINLRERENKLAIDNAEIERQRQQKQKEAKAAAEQRKKDADKAAKDFKTLRKSVLDPLTKEKELNQENLRLIREYRKFFPTNGALADAVANSETARHGQAQSKILKDQLRTELGDASKIDVSSDDALQKEAEQYEARLAVITGFHERTKDSAFVTNAAIEKEKMRHEETLAKIEKNKNKEREKAKVDFWNNTTSLMTSKSRKLFEIGKAAAIARAVVSATESVPHAFKWGTEIGGFPLGIAMAAAAVAATATQIQQLNAVEFNGGAKAVSPTAISAVPEISDTTITSQKTSEDIKQPVQIIFNGDVNGLDAEQIAESIKEVISDKDFILIDQNSRNGQHLVA